MFNASNIKIINESYIFKNQLKKVAKVKQGVQEYMSHSEASHLTFNDLKCK